MHELAGTPAMEKLQQVVEELEPEERAWLSTSCSRGS